MEAAWNTARSWAMKIRTCLLIILTASLPPLAPAAGEPAGAVTDPNAESALRLFAERERERAPQSPYAFAYPIAVPFSAQALEQQNRAQLYWLWQPNKLPGWQVVPYWPSAYPPGWPIIPSWMPAPVPTR
jgi:hypothetical protein